MATGQFKYKSSSGFSINTIISLIIGILILFGLFKLAQLAFNILYYLSPILLIITLIIDYKVVVDYGKWIWDSLRQNPIMGIVLIVLTIVGFPVVSLILLGKALLMKKVKEFHGEIEKKVKGEFVEYEEVKTERKTLELPPLKKQEKPMERPKEKQKNEYEDLFEE